MHYAHVPLEYWRHRSRMLKAMGLNTVATYVFWNFHEPKESVWDFTGDRNLAEFIKTAGEKGLMVSNSKLFHHPKTLGSLRFLFPG